MKRTTMSANKNTERKRILESITVKKLIEDYVYRIDLDADYQREKIWSRKNQEELLDSIIQDIDIPKLYLAEVQSDDSFDFECIDGKQRMTTLLDFYKPESGADNPLRVKVAGEKYSYKQLQKDLPKLAEKIDDFELTFVIYPEIEDDEFLREIFRRLQLGVRLNTGELLKTYTGSLRDFVYREMGKDAPFLKHTNLSEKRFSRQFTLAQICINSFGRAETGDFVRARYDDLADFFKDKYNLEDEDENLTRIREVLKTMDKDFGQEATAISSRAIAVSAYLFAESLYLSKRKSAIAKFAKFYLALLSEVKKNLKQLSDFLPPQNQTILEEFQKYVSQASVEPYSVKRRHKFLERGFKYFLDPKTKGKILGNH